MSKIKNANYRRFLDGGYIDIITDEQFNRALDNIKGKYKLEGRSLLISLYYTGARPVEILQLKGKSIIKDKNYIIVKIPGSKGGLPRSIHLRYKLKHVKELYQYSRGIFENMFLFYNFRNKYERIAKTKKGIVKRIEITGKLRYFIKKWFNGVIEDSITPYYLRHNRFSKLALKGIDDRTLRLIKGSKTAESINYYIHMSADISKKAAKKID